MSQKRKIANENASFVESLPELFEMMGDFLPEGERELFKAAAKDVGANCEQAAKELRSGAVDDALIARKPPALWELEKHMYNKLAREVGAPEIEDDDV